MPKPIVSVVGTGGTIASKYDASIGGHVSAATARDLVAAVPELADLAEVRVIEHSNVNSALMDTATAFALRNTLRKVLADDAVVGAVVTHGTATMEETAYLMDLTLGSGKPVIMTGAQRNFDEKDADGPRNLLYAAMVAVHPETRGRGVLICVGGEIHSARDATKVHPEHLTAFKGREDVQLIRMAQGANDLLLRACIGAPVDGIVVEGTAAGNVNLAFYRGICDALQAEIPVVVATRLPAGAPHPGKAYQGAFSSLLEQGAISAGYLSGLKARILLMVALAHTQDRGALREIFARAGGAR
ncbi:MAG: asparaginase [Betaproteobacteria bacterium]|nr:asparaginase [Betaproteobacteria bacterium]